MAEDRHAVEERAPERRVLQEQVDEERALATDDQLAPQHQRRDVGAEERCRRPECVARREDRLTDRGRIGFTVVVVVGIVVVVVGIVVVVVAIVVLVVVVGIVVVVLVVVLVVAVVVVVVVGGGGGVPTRYVDAGARLSKRRPVDDAHAACQPVRSRVVTRCTCNGSPEKGPFVLTVPTMSKVIGVSFDIGPKVTGAANDLTVVVPFMSFDVLGPFNAVCSRSEQVGKGCPANVLAMTMMDDVSVPFVTGMLVPGIPSAQPDSVPFVITRFVVLTFAGALTAFK